MNTELTARCTDAAKSFVASQIVPDTEVEIDHIVEWAVGAAFRELLSSLRKAPAEPVQAERHDGGGNIHEKGPTALGGPPEVLRDAAKAQGFTGDACRQCGNFTMRRSGVCETCATCGATTGCS